jgi:tetratricopeptide (TPR) repeat protein/DNA-binding XRE family transcriptional regulator
MTMSTEPGPFGAILTAFRHRRHLTQQQVAEKLGVHRNTIGSWERGDYLPESKGLVLELTRSLHLSNQEARQLLEASFTTLAPLWSVPFPRNPLFTGREEVLEILHARLGPERLVALTQSYALHGLGGVGKTQLALEYAYRHALEYRAIGWINAETVETITTSLVHMAEPFQFSDLLQSNQQQVLTEVQHWLATHSQWLLIWDNLEDFDLLSRFLPPARQGMVLITTRRQALGALAQGLYLAPMVQEEGRLLLLRRAKVLRLDATLELVQQVADSQPTEYAAAGELVHILGGLPLALDQAGAYIEETGCCLADYLRRYEQQSTRLLARRGAPEGDHPQSVAVTFQLALGQVEQQHPAAADMLRVCALLYAEAIPEELFGVGAAHLGPTLASLGDDPTQFDQAVAVLRNLSMVQRHPDIQTLSLHRLVQAVIREQMNKQEQVLWLQRITKALNSLFPKATLEAWETWKQDERLLPHVLAIADAFPPQKGIQELAEVLQKAAEYLLGLARYEQAEALYQRAIRVGELALGPEHPQVATSLNGLGRLYREHGKQKQAEALFQRALAIREKALGPMDPQVAYVLHNLAEIHAKEGEFEQAESFYQRALTIQERALGLVHPQVAYVLNNLAEIYAEQGKYKRAESFYQRALVIWEQAVGSDNPLVGYALHGLAEVYAGQGKYKQAEPFYLRALAIWEEAVGSEHPRVAITLDNLAHLYVEQDKYTQAEPLFLRALGIQEHRLGPRHPETAQTLHDLARLRQKQEHLREARALAKRALSIRAEVLGDHHPKTVDTYRLYAQLIRSQEGGAEPAPAHECAEQHAANAT